MLMISVDERRKEAVAVSDQVVKTQSDIGAF